MCLFIFLDGLEPELKTGYNFREGWAHAYIFCRGKIIESTTLSIPHGRDLLWYENITPCTIAGDASQDYDWWNSKYMKDKIE
ncbi:MAG: hypothetical protein PHO58_05725 [Bacilli bacterium]|nr:hypothetical protein [Bacilli bacterium]